MSNSDNKQTKGPYYRTLSSMYNVSDQNKTKIKSVVGHDSSMKMQSKFIIRKASCFLFKGKERNLL